MTTLDDAWQAALAAEHRAVFGYGLLGPRLSGADEQLAQAGDAAHQALRDATAAALATAGLDPVPPAADYPALYPVPSAGAARALAVRLEQDCAAAWRYLYSRAAVGAGGSGPVRLAAQTALTASAVRATRWRLRSGSTRPSVPFPGLS